MRRFLFSLLTAGAGLLPVAASAQTGGSIIVPGKNLSSTGVATRGAAFLSLGVGGRALALGGAFAATASDLSAAYWNVAGLGEVTTPSIFAAHEQLYGKSGLTNTFVAGALPAFGGVFGVSLTSFTSGDIPRTTEYYPDGGDPASGVTISWNATAVGVHYARQFTDRLAAGGTLKVADEGVDFARAQYYAADFGIRFRSGLAGTTLGFAVANLGSSGKMDGAALRRRVPKSNDPQLPIGRPIDIDLTAGRVQLPTTLRFGMQTDLVGSAGSLFGQPFGRPHTLTLLTDVTDGFDTGIMPAIAAEYGFFNRFFVRGGGRWLNDQREEQGQGISFSTGAGVSIPVAGRHFLLDYAWRGFGQLNANQAISLQFGN